MQDWFFGVPLVMSMIGGERRPDDQLLVLQPDEPEDQERDLRRLRLQLGSERPCSCDCCLVPRERALGLAEGGRVLLVPDVVACCPRRLALDLRELAAQPGHLDPESSSFMLDGTFHFGLYVTFLSFGVNAGDPRWTG